LFAPGVFAPHASTDPRIQPNTRANAYRSRKNSVRSVLVCKFATRYIPAPHVTVGSNRFGRAPQILAPRTTYKNAVPFSAGCVLRNYS
jgi:hypothetical protein